MRIDRITIRGVTTYREEQTLDLAALGSGLIAVAGPNGAGKSTLIEAIPGCLYRHAPSRGNIATLATSRDAQIEVVGFNGAPFTARLDMDSVSGKSEAVLIDGDSQPIAGPKVRDYDRAIAERFPPLDVYLAAAFACQTGAGSLLRRDRAGRRDLFAILLKLALLERLAAAARERAKACESDMTACRAALDAVRQGAGDVHTLAADLQAYQGDAARATAAQRDAQDRLRAVTSERDRLHATLAESQRAERLAQEAQRRAEGAAEALARLGAQAEALAPLLAEGPAIRAHAEALRAGEAELATLTAKAQAANVEATRAGTAAAEARQRATTAAATERDLRARLVALDGILGDAPAIRAQAANLVSLQAELARVRAAGEAAAEAQRAASEENVRHSNAAVAAAQKHAAENRAGADAALRRTEAQGRMQLAQRSSGAVPCAGVLADDARGACSALVGHFRARDEAQRQLDELDAGMAGRQIALDEARAASESSSAASLVARQAAVVAHERAESLRAEYRRLHQQHESLRVTDRSAALDRAEAEAGALQPGLDAAEKAARDAEVAADIDENTGVAKMYATMDAGKQRDALSARLADLRRSDRSVALAQAESDSAALGGRLEAARADSRARALEAMEAGAAVPSVDMDAILAAGESTAAAEKTSETCSRTAAEAERMATRIEAQLEAAREAQEKAAVLVAKVAPLERDLADFRFLARGLGREGVQALELDAAGPRVSDLANELLSSCWGGRFQVRFDTQVARADGKGVKEDFAITVLDHLRGRETDGQDLSGGEQVVVGAAIGRAIGWFHRQTAGDGFEQIFLDEATGALDEDARPQYAGMLRHLLKVGGISQCIFICHDRDLVDLADRVVRVTDGRIEVSQ